MMKVKISKVAKHHGQPTAFIVKVRGKKYREDSESGIFHTIRNRNSY